MSRTKVLAPLAILFAVLSLGTTASAGGGGCHNPTQTDTAGTTVDVGENCFGPTVLRVAQGQTVTWFNYDPVVHTITAAGGVFDQEIQPQRNFTYKFNSPGVYPYYCLIHPRMAGAVVVGDNDGNVVATAPRPVAALTEKTEDGTSPMSAALIAAFVAAPLSFVAGRILRGRRQPS